MVKLYYLSGSRHSKEAEELLSSRGVAFEKIDVSEVRALSDIRKDFGIKKLPTVIDDKSRYEGVKQIRRFLEKSKQ